MCSDFTSEFNSSSYLIKYGWLLTNSFPFHHADHLRTLSLLKERLHGEMIAPQYLPEFGEVYASETNPSVLNSRGEIVI